MTKWRHVEPEDGQFTWDALDANITKAAKLGLQLVVSVEICKADPSDPASPAWLFDSVPSVNFTKGPSPNGTTNPHRCPYYLDSTFQAKFDRLIEALARHISSLPSKSKKAVVAVQAMLGITGDD